MTVRCLIIILFIALSVIFIDVCCDNRLELGIDIAQFRNADHDAGEWHDDMHIRFFLPNGAIICESSLARVTDNQIPCAIEKKYLKRGHNVFHFAVFIKLPDDTWQELEHSRDEAEFDIPDNIPGLGPEKMLTRKNVLFATAGAGALASGIGSKLFLDAKRNAVIENPVPVAPKTEIDFPTASFPSIVRPTGFFQSPKVRVAAAGAAAGLVFGSRLLTDNRHLETISRSVVNETPEYAPAQVEYPEPTLLQRAKNNIFKAALLVVAQTGFWLYRRGRPTPYYQHLGAYDIWSELMRK